MFLIDYVGFKNKIIPIENKYILVHEFDTTSKGDIYTTFINTKREEETKIKRKRGLYTRILGTKYVIENITEENIVYFKSKKKVFQEISSFIKKNKKYREFVLERIHEGHSEFDSWIIQRIIEMYPEEFI